MEEGTDKTASGVTFCSEDTVISDQNKKEEDVLGDQRDSYLSYVPNVGACVTGRELGELCEPPASQPLDLNFLAVHSMAYIERERERIWNIYKGFFSPCLIRLDNYTRPKLPYHKWNSSFLSSVPEKKAVLSMHDMTYDAFDDIRIKSLNPQNLLCIPEHKQSIDHLSWGFSSDMLAEFVRRLKYKVVEMHSTERQAIKEGTCGRNDGYGFKSMGTKV